VRPIVPTVNKEIGILRSKGVKMVIAIGHEGATAGTFDNPTGPLINVADNLVGADAVLGDHSDFQTISYRPNGVLVTENKSKGSASRACAWCWMLRHNRSCIRPPTGTSHGTSA